MSSTTQYAVALPTAQVEAMRQALPSEFDDAAVITLAVHHLARALVDAGRMPAEAMDPNAATLDLAPTVLGLAEALGEPSDTPPAEAREPVGDEPMATTHPLHALTVHVPLSRSRRHFKFIERGSIAVRCVPRSEGAPGGYSSGLTFCADRERGDFDGYALVSPEWLAQALAALTPPAEAREPVGAHAVMLDDLAMIVRKLARELLKAKPDAEFPQKALDYLDRKGLHARILRAAADHSSTHHVHRGPESLPCYCPATMDHSIGDEALASAREPVGDAWECFRDVGYFDLWCVRPRGSRKFGEGFHVVRKEEAHALRDTLNSYAAQRDTRQAQGGGEDS